MTLNTKIAVNLAAVLESPLDLSTVDAPLNLDTVIRLASGTTAGKADKIWHDRRTLAASATENLDLAASLVDAFGAAITFARIKAILVKAAAANVNNVLVGGDVTNTFLTWVVAEDDAVVVRPGGLFLLVAPDATAYAVTASTGDLLKITNSSSGSSITYDIVLVGASA